MSKEIIVALIGVIGVIIAASIAAITSIISSKKMKISPRNSTVKQIEIVPNLNESNPYVGHLVDFVDGVSKENPFRIEIAVNDDGRIILFYTHTLRVHIKRIEYFSKEKRLVFVSDGEQMRALGLPVGDDVAKHLKDVDKILLVKLNVKTNQMVETGSLSFKIYE